MFLQEREEAQGQMLWFAAGPRVASIGGLVTIVPSQSLPPKILQLSSICPTEYCTIGTGPKQVVSIARHSSSWAVCLRHLHRRPMLLMMMTTTTTRHPAQLDGICLSRQKWTRQRSTISWHKDELSEFQSTRHMEQATNTPGLFLPESVDEKSPESQRQPPDV